MQNVLAYPAPSILRESSQGLERVSLADEFFARREIEAAGAIESGMAYSLCQQLRHLAKDDPAAPITVFVNSPGGLVRDGLAIYDVMQAIECPIRTVCLGQAASIAAVLFVAGDERDMLPHAQVMIHDPGVPGGLGGSAFTVKAISDDLMRARQATAGIIAKHTGHSVEEVLEATARGTCFEARTAVEWGLADRVIERL